MARVTITIVDNPPGLGDDVTLTIGSDPDLDDPENMTPAQAMGIALVSETLPRLLRENGASIERFIHIDPQRGGGRN